MSKAGKPRTPWLKGLVQMSACVFWTQRNYSYGLKSLSSMWTLKMSFCKTILKLSTLYIKFYSAIKFWLYWGSSHKLEEIWGEFTTTTIMGFMLQHISNEIKCFMKWNSWFWSSSLLPPFPLVTINLFSMSMSLFMFHKFICIIV